MPDIQEVYDMVTKQKPPEHGALERQQQRQIRAARSKKIGALLVAAVISVVAIAVIVMTRPAESGTNPTNVPIVDPADAPRCRSPRISPRPMAPSMPTARSDIWPTTPRLGGWRSIGSGDRPEDGR